MTIPNNVWIGAVQRYGRWIGAQQDNTTADHLSNFANRKEIRYGTAGVPASDLPGFPKLLEFTDTDIAAELSSNDGVCITLANGVTPVPMGLYPSADLASGYFLGRAKFDLDAGAAPDDVLGYIYFDSTQMTVENKPGVVSDGYVLFSPLEEDPSGTAPQILDWVTNTNLGTSGGSMTSGDLVTGQVGKALDFDGSDDYVSISADMGVTLFTVELAANPAMAGGSWQALLEHDRGGSNHYGIWKSASGSYWHYRWGGSSYAADAPSSSASNGTWCGLASTYDGTNGKGWFNGSLVVTAASSNSLVNSGIRIGGNNAAGEFFGGSIDEVRVSSVARSADWLAYAYTDDFDNVDTFYLASEGPSFDPSAGFPWQALATPYITRREAVAY